MRTNKNDRYNPVPHNQEEMLLKAMQDTEFAKIWNTPDPEMEALDIVLKARKKAGITQEQIAKRMHTSQAAVARIEKLASGNTKNLPSLVSLKKYAAALGLKLKIDFEAAK